MTTRFTPPHRGRIITAAIDTTASPDQLFEAWADPEKLAQWFPDRAEGRAEAGAIQTWCFDRFGYRLPYEVAAAVPGEHLVLTGEVPGRPRFYLEIDIRSAGGVTTLTLTNSGFLDAAGWDEEYEGISSGWRMSLALLKLYAERYLGKTRTQFFTMREAAYEYDALRRAYRDPERLKAWLTSEGHIGEPGEPYSLVLRDPPHRQAESPERREGARRNGARPPGRASDAVGGSAGAEPPGSRMSGTVLAVTGWEVQLSWDEIDGAVALKGFGMGGGRRAVCVHGSSWSLSAAQAAALEQQFGEALDRLATGLAEARATS
jgi:uncharacterized protein YndB with AHSA1/START domain